MTLQKVAKRLAGLNNVDEFSDQLDRGETAKNENRWVFESSFEVANKVGGIHQVIKSKAAVSTEELGEQYFMLGPYKEDSVRVEVELSEPSAPELQSSLKKLRDQGFKVHYGRWLIDGSPNVILFDIDSAFWKLDTWKRDLWESAAVGIPWNDKDSNDAVILGFLIAQFLQTFRSAFKKGRPLIVAHFHEWMSGVGLVMLRCWQVDISTVFTTHATLLGRYLCAGKVDLYNNLEKIDLDKEAGNKGMYHKYCLERASAHTAHVFTTVSEITGVESEHLLKRKPDILTPNGMNVIKFAALHEFQNLHALAKDKINDFIKGHFCGHYNFDLDKTLYFFTSGRYEYFNKGGDIFVEALSRLNHYLKVSTDPRCKDVTVVAFIIYDSSTACGSNAETLQGQAVAKGLRETLGKIKESMAHRMFEACMRGVMPSTSEWLLPAEQIHLKRCIFSMKVKKGKTLTYLLKSAGFQRHSLPPICTHNMSNDANDPVLSDLRRTQLFNNPDDRVKVIFHPQFLKAVDPPIRMDYEEFVRGCHLGVFPSYYEPWGYTPAECTVMGVPSITTNLSGFGCFIQENVTEPDNYGIYIVDRRYKCPEDSVKQLAQYMYDFCTLTRRQRIITRNRTERLSQLLDWKSLGANYREARRMAQMKTHPDMMGTMTEGKYALTTPRRIQRPLSLAPTPATSRSCHSDSDDYEQQLFDNAVWNG